MSNQQNFRKYKKQLAQDVELNVLGQPINKNNSFRAQLRSNMQSSDEEIKQILTVNAFG